VKDECCKPNFLYNTGTRRSSEVLFLTGKVFILEEFSYFSRNKKKLILV
jgi:hypothetical protein